MPIQLGESLEAIKRTSPWDYLGKGADVPPRLSTPQDLARHVGQGAFVDVVEFRPRIQGVDADVETVYAEPAGQNALTHEDMYHTTVVGFYEDGTAWGAPAGTWTAAELGAQNRDVYGGSHAFASRQPVAQAAMAMQQIIGL